MGIPPTRPWGYYLQTASLLPAPSHLRPPTRQPSYPSQRLLWRSIDGARASQPALSTTTIHVMRRALMAQQARRRLERQIANGYRRRFGIVGVACLSCPFFLGTESKNSRVATFTVFSRVHLYPFAAADIVTQTGLTGRTATTTHTFPQDRPYYKPGLCLSTSYSCITNFEYTLTFTSRPSDPITNKNTDPPITHHARQPFQSRVA
ncbi:hypothetical protein EDB89DRAFT_1974945 [Lactarius sanguifluus]|nr:hypothetical protein EDB89DRAFT_1974945 [Lactarius sanguifluus]